MTDKERLENINPIGVDNEGNITLKGDDYHWLLNQAEKAEKLQEENKRLRKALEFYANKETYESVLIGESLRRLTNLF